MDCEPSTAATIAFVIDAGVVVAWVLYGLLTHRGKVKTRALFIADIRRKRIMRENLETWNRENRDFIEKCNREVDAEVDRIGESCATDDEEVEESGAAAAAGYYYGNQGDL